MSDGAACPDCGTNIERHLAALRAEVIAMREERAFRIKRQEHTEERLGTVESYADDYVAMWNADRARVARARVLLARWERLGDSTGSGLLDDTRAFLRDEVKP